MAVSNTPWSRLREALRSRRSQRSEKRLSTARIDQATESIIDASNPRVRAVTGYRRALRPVTERVLVHCTAMAEEVPGPVTVNNETWVKDPMVNALFGSVQSLREALTRSPAIRRAFREHPEWSQCHALLSVKLEQRKELGMKLHGDAPRRDVLQNRITFTDHELLLPSATEQGLRTALENELLTRCIKPAVRQLDARHNEIDRLEKQRQVLKSRIRLHSKTGTEKATSDQYREQHAQIPIPAQRELEELEMAIAAAREGLSDFHDYLDRLVELMAQPELLFRLETRSFRLDRMNLLHDEEDDAQTVELSFCQSIVEDLPDRALLILKIARSELLPEDHFLKQAERLWGV